MNMELKLKSKYLLFENEGNERRKKEITTSTSWNYVKKENIWENKIEAVNDAQE